MCARGRRCCGRGVSLDGVTLLSPFRLVADTIERHSDSIGADSIAVLLWQSGHRPSVGLSSHAGAEMGQGQNATEACGLSGNRPVESVNQSVSGACRT